MRKERRKVITTRMTNEMIVPPQGTATVTQQGANVAPEKAASNKDMGRKKAAPKGRKTVKGADAAKKTASAAKKGRRASKQTSHKAAATQRSGHKAQRSNKKAEVIAMMQRAHGATLAEIVAATGWRKHTVRGFVSILGKKGEAKIDSSKNAAGERTYKVGK